MHGEGLSVQRGAVALGRWNKIYIYMAILKRGKWRFMLVGFGLFYLLR